MLALALHAAFALALTTLRAATMSVPPSLRPIELTWIAPAAVVRERPVEARVQAPAPARSGHAAAIAHAHPAAIVEAPKLASPPPASEAPATGPADLFPRALLESLAGEHAPATSTATKQDTRETPGGWLSDDAAEGRTRAGQVAPLWRDVERGLTLDFKPPPSLVHDTDVPGLGRAGSYFKQLIATVARGEDGVRQPREPGSRALEQGPSGSIDPSQQNFTGTPEGSNLRAMPLQQQQAMMAATSKPASWLHVEIETTIDGTGEVRARVVLPSGRRAFDRFALAAIRDRLLHAGAPASQSRWLFEAGYAVSRPDSIGLNFDLSMLFDKQLRRQLALDYPLKERVETKVSLKWVKPFPQ